jgi:para-aminobenzoate synthetase/4-amino-4-deoxychorismate lyase
VPTKPLLSAPPTPLPAAAYTRKTSPGAGIDSTITRYARFDDLENGTAFELTDPVEVLQAEATAAVPAVLAEAERAAASGRWVAGWVAYEAAPAFDPALVVRSPHPGLPLAWFGIFDERVPIEPVGIRSVGPAQYTVSSWSPSIGLSRYEDGVRTIRRHIAEGDTYQVNYTFRLAASFAGSALGLYRDMSVSQRGAYGAFLDTGRFHVASTSPELFYRRRGRHITTKPMKGTVRRGRWPAEDSELHRWLRDSEKDQAENLMIVDLLRNDLGRIAEFGTVEVERLFETERYETVWQATSTITAEARDGVADSDVFGALFPSGSVTGAPKPRTTEIIAKLERSPRGVYCGAVGYLAPPGSGGADARFNVAIRTVVIDTDEGTAEYGVGGGITWDSSPKGEYEEARDKARVLVERRPDFELLETLRFEVEGGFLWLQEHLDRMSASAAHFGFDFDEAACRSALHDAVSGVGVGPYRVRLISDRNGSVKAEASVLENAPVPTTVAIDDEPVSSRNVFLFHKNTRRAVYDERLARHPDAEDVLLVNERGEVTESTVANLLVKIDDGWYTPPLDSGCLPGIYRAQLVEKAEVSERVITVAELERAEAVELVNSVRGRWAAVLG